MSRFAVIVPAAGRSSRFGDPKLKKVFAEVDGRAVWLRSIEPFVNRDEAQSGDIVLLAGKGHEKVQVTREGSLPFDDVAVAREALRAAGFECEATGQ